MFLLKALIYLIVLSPAVIWAQQMPVTIYGDIKGLSKGTTIELTTKSMIDFDKKVLVKKIKSQKGKFSLIAVVNEPGYFEMQISGTSWKTLLFIDTTQLSVSGNIDSAELTVIRGGQYYRDKELNQTIISKPWWAAYEKQQAQLEIAQQEKDSLATYRIKQSINDTAQIFQQRRLAFFTGKPNSWFILTELMKEPFLDDPKIKVIYSSLDAPLRKSAIGEYTGAQIEIAQKVRAGEKAPDFTATKPDGSLGTLYDEIAKHEITLIDFWASWCAPCRAENPNLKKMYEKYGRFGFGILGVSSDARKNEWQNALKEDASPWAQYREDSSFSASTLFAVRAVPNFVLVNKNGLILKRGIGLMGKGLDRELAAIFLINKDTSLGDQTLFNFNEWMQLMNTVSNYENLDSVDVLAEQLHRRSTTGIINKELAFSVSNAFQNFAVTAFKQNQIKLFRKYVDYILYPVDVAMVNAFIARENIEKGNILFLDSLARESVTIMENDVKQLDNSSVFTGEQRARSTEQYAAALDVYAYISFRQNKIPEAIQLAEKSMAINKKYTGKTLQQYLDYLVSSSQYDKVLDECEKDINITLLNPEIRKIIKTSYLKKHNSLTGYDEYVSKFDDRANKLIELQLLKTAIDRPAPSFSVRNTQNKIVSLSGLSGKTVVLDFWATWCGPCKASFPAMQATKDIFRSDSNVVFLFVNTQETLADEKRIQVINRFMQTNKYDFQILLDVKNPTGGAYEISKVYTVTGIPHKVVISPRGRVVFESAGYGGETEPFTRELTAMIKLAKDR